LLQIILDEEAQGAPIFSSELLANVIRFYGNSMQGVMGVYLEKSIHSFLDAQQKFQEQAKALYGEVPNFNADMWTQFFNNQSPQANLMGNYVEQSANMFLQMQEQMRKQALSFFGGFPFAAPEQKTNEETQSQEPTDPSNKRS
jgi:polyhydroxyalkanoate synthesis regulator protein